VTRGQTSICCYLLGVKPRLVKIPLDKWPSIRAESRQYCQLFPNEKDPFPSLRKTGVSKHRQGVCVYSGVVFIMAFQAISLVLFYFFRQLQSLLLLFYSSERQIRYISNDLVQKCLFFDEQKVDFTRPTLPEKAIMNTGLYPSLHSKNYCSRFFTPRQFITDKPPWKMLRHGEKFWCTRALSVRWHLAKLSICSPFCFIILKRFVDFNVLSKLACLVTLWNDSKLKIFEIWK